MKNNTYEENVEQATDILLKGSFSYIKLDNELDAVLREATNHLTYALKKTYEAYDRDMYGEAIDQLVGYRIGDLVGSIHKDFINNPKTLRKFAKRLIRKYFSEENLLVLLPNTNKGE